MSIDAIDKIDSLHLFHPTFWPCADIGYILMSFPTCSVIFYLIVFTTHMLEFCYCVFLQNPTFWPCADIHIYVFSCFFCHFLPGCVHNTYVRVLMWHFPPKSYLLAMCCVHIYEFSCFFCHFLPSCVHNTYVRVLLLHFPPKSYLLAMCWCTYLWVFLLFLSFST